MQQNDEWKKRPLLTLEQLRIITRGRERVKKGTPRQEFEKLFRTADATPR